MKYPFPRISYDVTLRGGPAHGHKITISEDAPFIRVFVAIPIPPIRLARLKPLDCVPPINSEIHQYEPDGVYIGQEKP